MSIAGIAILTIALLLVLFSSRRWATIGMMIGVLYLTQGQTILILGFNLYALRILGLACFLRVLCRKEFTIPRLNTIDKALIFLYTYTTIVFLIRSNQYQAYQIGTTTDAIFCYFSFRGLLIDAGDYKWFLRSILYLLIPYAAIIAVESFTSYKLFSSMGGIDLVGPEWYREGRIRCQGSFRHPSLLGTLGASYLPLYISILFCAGFRRIAVIGIFVCLFLVWASNSGAPLSCAAVALLGWLLWKLRFRLRALRYGTAVMLMLLALSMNAPIWYILTKVSSISGGGGYHRSYLLDTAFKHFDRWGFAGMPIEDTADWFPYVLEATHGADMTNQFLSFGVAAGIIAVFLFIYLLVSAFSALGRTFTILRSKCDLEKELIVWGMGVMLSVHFFNWLGITYFDQTYAIWFLQLAAISSITENILNSSQSEYT